MTPSSGTYLLTLRTNLWGGVREGGSCNLLGARPEGGNLITN